MRVAFCLLFLFLPVCTTLLHCLSFSVSACLLVALVCVVTLAVRIFSYVLPLLSCLLLLSSHLRMPRGRRRITVSGRSSYEAASMLLYFGFFTCNILFMDYFFVLPIPARPDDPESACALSSHLHPTVQLGASASFHLSLVYMRYVMVSYLSNAQERVLMPLHVVFNWSALHVPFDCTVNFLTFAFTPHPHLLILLLFFYL